MDYDYVIIGAGVVGLAVTEYLTRNKMQVLLIEKENRIGTGVSSRNSEVIHAGIYYPPGSLKSVLCLRGKELLYSWCRKYNVPHNNIGKYIIATTEEELARLQSVMTNALNAGLKELYLKTASEITSQEPEICCVGGLYSPTTGIVSAHGLMDSLKQKAEEQGADILFNSKLISLQKSADGNSYLAEIQDSTGEINEIETGGIINCAGLYSDQVAETLGTFKEEYRMHFIKGNYFRLRGHQNIFRHLVYPVPMPKLHGLGVHITLDLNGGVRFGPDVEKEPLTEENYQINESRRDDFYLAVRKYFPGIKPGDLMPDMTGIRPRLANEKEFNDFIICDEEKAGYPRIINCIGIESPGLTSSLAIAEYIYNKYIAN